MAGYAVFDTETTGLSPGWRHRVVEIGIVQLDERGAETGSWATLLNPGRDLGPQHVHGITGAQVMRAPTFEQVAGDIAAVMGGRLVVGHNVGFDVAFLRHEFRLLGVPLPAGDGWQLDTMALARAYLPGTGRSLAACCRATGVDNPAAHSALSDARATADLLRWMLAVAGSPPRWHDRLTGGTPWPELPPGTRPPMTRDEVPDEPHFLRRLVERLPRAGTTAGVAFATGTAVPVDGYLAVLDRALVGRHLSLHDQDELVRVAGRLGVGPAEADLLHRYYLGDLVGAASLDGAVTAERRADLAAVTALLGLEPAALDEALTAAQATAGDPATGGPAAEDPAAGRVAGGPGDGFRLEAGDEVVLTGTSSRRADLEIRCLAGGLDLRGTVTRRTRLVCAADQDTESVKARRARRYGIPVVGLDAFERLLDTLEN